MRDYLRIARLDHWGKNLFMFPGVALAISFHASLNQLPSISIWRLSMGFLGLCLVSSANYTINEWLDREFDRLHPWKNHRPAVREHLNPRLVWIQWGVLALTGLYATAFAGHFAFICNLLLLLMGIVYNVKPLRTKDKTYLDVVSESVNNPLRMALGWYCVTQLEAVPASAFIAFWGGGIFLMALKRHTEMALVRDPTLMAAYRPSFSRWTKPSLLTFAMTGSLVCCSFLGILLAGYRLEYVLLIPLVIGLFQHYLRMALMQDLSAIKPEQLWKQKGLHIWVSIILIAAIVLSFVNFPLLESLAGF